MKKYEELNCEELKSINGGGWMAEALGYMVGTIQGIGDFLYDTGVGMFVEGTRS